MKGETANFIALQKRYMKGFLGVYYRYNDQVSLIHNATALEDSVSGGRSTNPHHQWSIRNTAMYLVDSDFDTEDEAFGDDIEEVISSGHGGSDDNAGLHDDHLQDNFFSRQAALTNKIQELKQIALGKDLGANAQDPSPNATNGAPEATQTAGGQGTRKNRKR